MPKSSKKAMIQPIGDRVLVRPFDADEAHTTTNSGIIIPDTIDKEKPAQGEVIAVGDGKIVDGKKIAVAVKKGDTVVFSKYGYEEVSVGDEDYYILKEDQILAVIK